MEKTLKVTESSDLYRKIDALGLPASERSKAMNAVDLAERLTRLVFLVLGWAGVVSTHLGPNPRLKHE